MFLRCVTPISLYCIFSNTEEATWGCGKCPVATDGVLWLQSRGALLSTDRSAATATGLWTWRFLPARRDWMDFVYKLRWGWFIWMRVHWSPSGTRSSFASVSAPPPGCCRETSAMRYDCWCEKAECCTMRWGSGWGWHDVNTPPTD